PRVSGPIVFTVAPRTPALMAMWYAGKAFPRSDRSPVMIPHAHPKLAKAAKASGVRRMLRPVDRITSGFYISEAMELRP
ncbi:MAG: magnesium protoporphyrin IX methyltransferase, partial [Tateyamaria sp.]